VEAIRAFLQTAAPDMLTKVLQPHGAVLAKLVPEVGERLSQMPPLPAIGPEEERLRLFEGLAGFFTAVATEQPLALFLDDLQWAPAMDSLHHLARSVATERLIVLGTYRDAELKEKPALAKTVLAMNRERLFHSLPLKRLTGDEVTQLVAQALGEAPSPELSVMVYQKTEGNPFFVEEMVRYFTESGTVTLGEKGWEPREHTLVQLPDSVKGVVGERLERLGAEARGVLAWAAVAGQEFTLPLLQEVAGLEEEPLLEVVDQAVAARILTSSPSLHQEAYAFADEVVRDVLYEGIGPARRRRYHLKVAQATEKVYTRHPSTRLRTGLEQHYDALARHFLEGNSLEKAFEYSLKAGDRAASVYSWERAIGHYQTALELLEELEADPHQQAEVLEKLGLVTGFSKAKGALGYLEKALSIYENLGDNQQAGQSHLRLGQQYLYYEMGIRDGARRLHSHALKAVALLEPEGESSQLARAYTLLGFSAAHQPGPLSAGIASLEKGLALAEQVGDALVIAEAATSLAHVLLVHTGEIQRGLELAQQSYEAARRSGDPVRLSDALRNLSLSSASLHDTESALRWTEQFVEAAWQSGLFRAQIASTVTLAWCFMLRGDMAQALSSLEIAQQMASQGGVGWVYTGPIDAVPGLVPLFRGDWDEAEAKLLQRLEDAKETHRSVGRQVNLGALGWLYLERGDLASAMAHLQEAVAISQARGEKTLGVLPALHKKCPLHKKSGFCTKSGLLGKL
jgi:tetratricopeptide (TPR) repeat protein